MSTNRHELNDQNPQTGYENELWRDEWPAVSEQKPGFFAKLFHPQPTLDWDGMLDFEDRFGVSTDRAIATPRPFYSSLVDKFLERFF